MFIIRLDPTTRGSPARISLDVWPRFWWKKNEEGLHGISGTQQSSCHPGTVEFIARVSCTEGMEHRVEHCGQAMESQSGHAAAAKLSQLAMPSFANLLRQMVCAILLVFVAVST